MLLQEKGSEIYKVDFTYLIWEGYHVKWGVIVYEHTGIKHVVFLSQ